MTGHAAEQTLSFFISRSYAKTRGQGASLRDKNISKSAFELGAGCTSTTPHL